MRKAAPWPSRGPGAALAELIGRAAPPLPTSTHGNAQLPHLAKGKAPLELVVPFKGKGELPGKWSPGGRPRGERVGDSRPSLPQRLAERRPPPDRCPGVAAPPGPLTLVSVGEVRSVHAVSQTLGGPGTILCRTVAGEDGPQGGRCWALRRLAPTCPVEVAASETVGVASTVAGTDTYRRSHSCNHHKRSCQGRGQPGPEGDLQRDIKVPSALGAEAESHGGETQRSHGSSKDKQRSQQTAQPPPSPALLPVCPHWNLATLALHEGEIPRNRSV